MEVEETDEGDMALNIEYVEDFDESDEEEGLAVEEERGGSKHE
jgi:hypothetical protein